MEAFFEAMGLPTRLARYDNVQPDTPATVAARLESRGMVKLGEHGDVAPKTVTDILSRSLAA